MDKHKDVHGKKQQEENKHRHQVEEEMNDARHRIDELKQKLNFEGEKKHKSSSEDNWNRKKNEKIEKDSDETSGNFDNNFLHDLHMSMGKHGHGDHRKSHHSHGRDRDNEHVHKHGHKHNYGQIHEHNHRHRNGHSHGHSYEHHHGHSRGHSAKHSHRHDNKHGDNFKHKHSAVDSHEHTYGDEDENSHRFAKGHSHDAGHQLSHHHNSGLIHYDQLRSKGHHGRHSKSGLHSDEKLQLLTPNSSHWNGFQTHTKKGAKEVKHGKNSWDNDEVGLKAGKWDSGKDLKKEANKALSRKEGT